ncbi:MAG: Pre-mRNA-processing factor 19, partial [Paramarteilia canceri]
MLLLNGKDNENKSNEKAQKDKNSVYTSIQLHPDGHIFGLGLSNGSISMWNLLAGEQALVFESQGESIEAISFSENGYHLASISKT